MHQWYVVQVISSQEKRVKKALEENRESKGMAELVSDILVPTENVAEVKKGEQKVSEKRLWPGYILVRMNLTDDSWMYVKDTNGVIGFLGGEKPLPLPDREVELILTDLEEKKKGIVQKHNIQIGDKVKITDGVFVNFIGSVIEVFHDKGRLSVMVSIFGHLSAWRVAKHSRTQGPTDSRVWAEPRVPGWRRSSANAKRHDRQPSSQRRHGTTSRGWAPAVHRKVRRGRPVGTLPDGGRCPGQDHRGVDPVGLDVAAAAFGLHQSVRSREARLAGGRPHARDL